MTQDKVYGPIDYVRVNRSGGHIEYLIGVPSDGAVLLSSSMNMPDNELLVAMGLPITPAALALFACAEREIMFLERGRSRGRGFIEPAIVRKLKAGGFDLHETLLAPLDGWDDGDWTFLRGYALHGKETDTAAALSDAMRRESTCNAGLYDTVGEWLREAELSYDAARAAKSSLSGRGGDQ